MKSFIGLLLAFSLSCRAAAFNFGVNMRALRRTRMGPMQMAIQEVSDGEPSAVIMGKLANVIDPDAGDDIISAGLVKRLQVTPNGDVKFSLTVENLKSPMNEEMKNLCLSELKAIPWVKNVEIEFVSASSSTDPTPPSSGAVDQAPPQIPAGMKNVKNIIAVSSCKGGVGKSTVSVNLAYTLQRAGAKVGILDADIYGPSLPTVSSHSLHFEDVLWFQQQR
jgi:metal-sulfur cluster biosynthetic enzyme